MYVLARHVPADRLCASVVLPRHARGRHAGALQPVPGRMDPSTRVDTNTSSCLDFQGLWDAQAWLAPPSM